MSSDNTQAVTQSNTFASRLFQRVMTERKKDEEKRLSAANVGKVAFPNQQPKEPAGTAKN